MAEAHKNKVAFHQLIATQTDRSQHPPNTGVSSLAPTLQGQREPSVAGTEAMAGGSQQQQWTERVTGRPVKPSCHCGFQFPTYEATASRGTLRACETAKRHLEKKEKTRQC